MEIGWKVKIGGSCDKERIYQNIQEVFDSATKGWRKKGREGSGGLKLN
jgi:hypothetical protein